jgi:kumamolisin
MVGNAQGQYMMTRHMRSEVASGQAKLVNRLPGTEILRLDIVLPLSDRAGLQDFLQEVYDPTSPIYRQFLTVPQFTERFGPTQDDYDTVVAFAEASGFKVVGGSRDGFDVQIEGSVTVIEAAFNVSMGVYQHPTENRTFYAPDREPSAPLPFPLWHISGLDNYSIPHPALMQRQPGAQPTATTGSGPFASFLGSDMRAAYYGQTILTGSGQSVGLFEFYGTDLADVSTYFSNVNQSNNVSINLISTDGTSTSCQYSQGCDDAESVIDITQAVSMAPGMSGLYVFVGESDTAILSAMTTTNYAPLSAQLSCSWLWTPADPTTDDPYFEKMASQGQNFFAAAGDSGMWTSKKATYPAEDANVVSVGGTDLITDGEGGAWESETAWIHGGGGVSPHRILIPSWQRLTGVINSSNEGSPVFRNGPDVSANADFSYYVCADQSGCTANVYGGTSFAAPLWAGYLALVNQQAVEINKPVLGFLNPRIYPLGVGSHYHADFHDITSGSNGYPAVPGCDLVTGWGTPNGVNLINALAPPFFTLSASPSGLAVVQGERAATTITSRVTGSFESVISLSASGLPRGVTASFSPASITAAGTSTLTLAVSSTTKPGEYPITVTGTSGALTKTTIVSLNVIIAPSANFALSAYPTAVLVVQGSSGTSTITSAVTGGFDSSISLSASGQPAGVTATFSPASITGPGTSTLTLAVASTTAIGTYSITVSGVSGTTTEITTLSLTVTLSGSTPDFILSASPSSLTVNWTSSGTSTIIATGGYTSPLSLSASGLPWDVTVSFAPSSIAPPGPGTSTMQINVGAGATAGTYSLTVTGSGGGKTHTTTITLTIKI